MTFNSTGVTRAALLASALCISAPTFAKSPAEVVADEFIDFATAQSMGVTVGSRDVSGDGVRLSDVVYTTDQKDVSVKVAMDWIEFKGLGGDTVAITFAPEVVGEFLGKTEPKGGMSFVMRNDGLVYVASGTADARKYDITGGSIAFDMKMLDGTPEMDAFDLTLSMTDLSGNALMLGGPTGTIKSGLRMGEMTMDYVFAADGMQAKTVSSFKDLQLDYAGDVINEETAESLFTGERGMSMNFATGENTGSGNIVTQDGMSIDFDTKAASSNAVISLGNGQIEYDVSAQGVTYNLVSPALPIPPVDLSMSEFGVRFAMPMGKAGTSGDLGMRMTLRDLLVSEGLWAMVDPGKILPRDPATLNIDLAGKATTLVNFTNTEAMIALGGRPPMDVSDVSINDITLRVAGAELVAKGAATLDNSGPIPVPNGKVEASVRGVNGLIDKLMQLGLISAQEAMPARMMMGMFAVPGDGPDHLKSEIVFQPDGRILANGIPIR